MRGQQEFGEPGLFVAFEETADELIANVRSLGWDLAELIDSHGLVVDSVQVDPHEIIETGTYNLEGLFVRLNMGIEAVGAKRIVLDTVENLFSSFRDASILRAEMRRLIRWLKERAVTAVFTCELNADGNARFGIEEYVSDCVIRLDHRIAEQVSTRRLRISKYRGSRHGTNEYPFTVGEQGFEILPITDIGLMAEVSAERVSTGIPKLDALFDGQGPFRGSSILIAGTAGTGKTSFSACFVDAACRRGERALYLSLEESPAQLQRNMRSIGLDLDHWRQQGLLTLSAVRPTAMGLEAHLVRIFSLVAQTEPQLVVVDPITHLSPNSQLLDQQAILNNLLDHLKMKGVTCVLTDLTRSGNPLETTTSTISSLIDSWLVLRDLESSGERNRLVYLIKSRGMAHSNQLREYLISDQGIDLVDVCRGSTGVLTGSARYSQEAKERAEAEARKRASERNRDSLARQRRIAEARIAVIQTELAEEEARLIEEIEAEKSITGRLESDQSAIAIRRGAEGGLDKVPEGLFKPDPGKCK